jgi:Zinc carboxypeptidase
MRSVFISAVLGVSFAASIASAQSGAAAAAMPGLAYGAEFFPGATYDQAVPTPDSVLGYRLGDKAASPAEIEAVIKAIAAKSPRVKLFEYARSHEGRPLHYLVVSSPETIARLDTVKADVAKFADPRIVTTAQGDALAEKLPLVAWMAYCIHGDEMSSSDGALSVIYHLAASTDEDVKAMLGNLIIVIDPLMNPDGRDRSVTLIRQRRTTQPDVDDQSILHQQLWPSGRMNHYVFDMNRDWIFGTQPETRGRIEVAKQWNPQYFMESHEMGSQDTFLFMPAREPINYNYPEHAHRWGHEIQKDNAAAFDALGWRYYSGEWNESWYPGYSSTWGALRGAIEQLYEMANIHTDAVRRPEGTLISYRESVHHQIVSSWSNLSSLSKNRVAIMKDFVASKRKNVAAEGRFASRVFAFPPSANTGRMKRFLDLALLQGFEVFETKDAFAGSGVDRLGSAVTEREFPAGTLLISTRQPLGNLVAAMLEFDPKFREEFLVEERRELLRFDESRLYDTTAWNIPMLFDVEAFELAMSIPASATRLEKMKPTTPAVEVKSSTSKPVAWIADGRDDRAVALAARLMESGVWVRYVEKATRFDSAEHARGAIAVVAKDNTNFQGSLEAEVLKAAAEVGLTMTAVTSGLGAGDLPDLGGGHFQLLQQPRVALLGQSPISPYAYGEVWHLLDHTLGMRSTSIEFESLGGIDLRRYNTLIIPSGARADDLSPHMSALREWVEQGGTLIAMESSAAVFAKEGGIGSTRLLPDVLGKLDEYRLAAIRAWEGLAAAPTSEMVYSRKPPETVEYPWVVEEGDKASDEELKRRDQWRQIFAPQGAVLAGRVDDRHWLTAGCGSMLPVLYGGRTVLMAPTSVQAPVRLGVFVEAKKKEEESAGAGTGDGAKADAKPEAKVDAQADGKAGVAESKGESKEPAPAKASEKAEPAKPKPAGWRVAPKGHEMVLRMSGLLWPEAADRVANSAWVTREGVGRGQIILFASNPTTRAATLGTQRVLSNAIVLGPGLGARATIRP